MNHRSCCCGCGNRACRGKEFLYSSIGETTKDTNCPICAIGRTSYVRESAHDAYFAPSDPYKNQQSDLIWQDFARANHDNLYVGNLCWGPSIFSVDNEPETHCPPHCDMTIPSGFKSKWTGNGVGCDTGNPLAYHYGNSFEDMRDDETFGKYPTDCGWDSCWEYYPGFGTQYPFFYQFDSPMGTLPFSPQCFMDWINNWDGPLLPQGDCSMHCTKDNIDCHSIAFVGSLSRRYGSGGERKILGNNDPRDDSQSEFWNMPICDTNNRGPITLPPVLEIDENDVINYEEWEWVREWVISGGKLVVMAEAPHDFSGVNGTSACGMGNFYYPGVWPHFKDGLKCEDQEELTTDNYPTINISGVGSWWSGNQSEVEILLSEFAYFCGSTSGVIGDEENRFYEHAPYTEDYKGDIGFINDIDFQDIENVGVLPKTCCQRTRSGEFKKENDEEKETSFSFFTSRAGGLVPISENGGKPLVGACNYGIGDVGPCTVVFKPNGKGAVIVVYDSNAWGASTSQIKQSWFDWEAEDPEVEYTAEELKLRSCNNDFWKFLCEEFLKDEDDPYEPTSCDTPVYWDNKGPDFTDNPCLPTAACCLPDGSCEESNVWDCFQKKGRWRQSSKNVNKASTTTHWIHGPGAGLWTGQLGQSAVNNPWSNCGYLGESGYSSGPYSGESKWCLSSCEEEDCEPLEKGVCCKWKSDGWGIEGDYKCAGTDMYKYECCEKLGGLGKLKAGMEDHENPMAHKGLWAAGQECDWCPTDGTTPTTDPTDPPTTPSTTDPPTTPSTTPSTTDTTDTTTTTATDPPTTTTTTVDPADIPCIPGCQDECGCCYCTYNCYSCCHQFPSEGCYVDCGSCSDTPI